MDELWHSTEELYNTDGAGTGTYIEVNGAQLAVEPGAVMRDTIIMTAREAGLGKFRVYLNGQEIKPSQAPETFVEGDQVRLLPFDVAGIC